MPIYKCTGCDYVTRDKSNFSKHILSNKHKEKEQEIVKINLEEHQRNISKNQNKRYKCPYCKINYATSGSLARHKRTCETKEDVLNNLQIEIDNLKNEISNLKKSHRKDIKLYLTQIEKLEKENEWLKSTVTGAGSIIKSSMSTANYIISTFKDAPALSPVKDYSKLTYARNSTEDDNSDEEMSYSEKMRESFVDHDSSNSNINSDDDLSEKDYGEVGDRFHDEDYDKEKFIEEITYQYYNKSLSNYLGDIIVKHYKKKDPEKQSIWNSDSTRLTYIVRELFTDDKIDWLVDKKGIKTTNYIITPFLKHIHELAKWYMELKTDFDRKSATTKELQARFSNLKACAEIQIEIEKKILSTEILKYIAPFFYYMKKDDKLLK